MSYIDTILEKAAKKADAAEVYHLKTESTASTWNADKPNIAETKETMGIALRVLIGGQVGFFASNKLDDPDKIVNAACELAPFGSKFAGEFPKTYKPAKGSFFDKPTSEIKIGKLIESGNRAVSAIKAARSEAINEAKLECSVVVVEIGNTYGARATYRKTGFDGFFMGSVTKEGDVLNLYEYGASQSFEDQPDEWAKEMGRKLKAAAKIVDLPSGEYKCIVTPKAAGFFGPIQLAMNARSVLKDMSPFKDKVGEQVFDERVTLIDDALYAKMPGSQPIDDEGVTSQRTHLVEKGVLKGFIHDLHTARLMGVAPTGNGQRPGLTSAPKVGYTNLCLTPGKKKLAEMIKEMGRGVVIDQIMGAHQASPFSGEFNVSVDLGFVVEGGEIVGRFKDGMLSGNVFKMLKELIIEIGSEAQYTGLVIPPVTYDRMAVTTGSPAS